MSQEEADGPAGKVLSDGSPIEQYSIKESDQIICMVSKVSIGYTDVFKTRRLTQQTAQSIRFDTGSEHPCNLPSCFNASSTHSKYRNSSSECTCDANSSSTSSTARRKKVRRYISTHARPSETGSNREYGVDGFPTCGGRASHARCFLQPGSCCGVSLERECCVDASFIPRLIIEIRESPKTSNKRPPALNALLLHQLHLPVNRQQLETPWLPPTPLQALKVMSR